MFIINLHYVVPLEELDAHMTDHVKYLHKYYKQDVFVASGRKVPRTGGIILAVGKSKEEIDKILSEDPFHIHGLAEFTVTEFLTSQSHPEFKTFLKTYG
ncbi:MAG: YciI family protein [Cyclobacteriaceae bacterium]